MDTNFSERRLKRALEHVSTFWLPVIENNLNLIKQKCSQLDYEAVEDILRKDPGLYLYLCKEQAKDGIEIYEGPCIFNIDKYIPNSVKIISPYRLDSALEVQLIKQQEVILNLVTALTLSRKFNLNEKHTYTTALLKSLGLYLIAWNYSDTYNQALSLVRPTESLEHVLTKLLGFSPTMLASKIVGNWGLKQEIIDETFYHKQTAISEVCKVSEIFAKVNSPKINLVSEKDWHRANNEIEKLVGKSAILQIQNIYEAFVKDLPLELIDLSNRPSFGKFNSPSFSQELPWEVKSEIDNFYESLNSVSTNEALKIVVNKIFPHTDFSGLMIFTIDQLSNRLLKQCQVGEILNQIQTIELNGLSNFDPFSKAIKLSEQVITGSVQYLNNTKSFLLLNLYLIKDNKKFTFGVLYLEGDFLISESSLKFKKLQARAIKEALIDSLNL